MTQILTFILCHWLNQHKNGTVFILWLFHHSLQLIYQFSLNLKAFKRVAWRWTGLLQESLWVCHLFMEPHGHNGSQGGESTDNVECVQSAEAGIRNNGRVQTRICPGDGGCMYSQVAACPSQKLLDTFRFFSFLNGCSTSAMTLFICVGLLSDFDCIWFMLVLTGMQTPPPPPTPTPLCFMLPSSVGSRSYGSDDLWLTMIMPLPLMVKPIKALDPK